MKTLIPVAAVVLCAVPAGRAIPQGLGQPLDGEHRMILTQKDAVAMMPAEVICGPVVQETAFSGSGRYLLVVRQAMKMSQETLARTLATQAPPPTETSILLWDTQTREARTVFRAVGDVRPTVKWMTGADIALALVSERPVPVMTRPQNGVPRVIERQTLLRIHPASDRAQILAVTDDVNREMFQLYVSPVQPLAILHRSLNQQDPRTGMALPLNLDAVTAIGPDGREAKTFPAAPDFAVLTVEWTAEGSPILSGVIHAGKQRAQRRLVLDVKTGATTPIEKAPPPPVVAAPAPSLSRSMGLRLKQSTAVVMEEKTSLPVGTLWLESIESTDAPRALVSGDCMGGRFTPAGDAILFQSQHTLMAVPLLRVDKALFLAAREAAKRMQLLNNGKQIALASLMYAQDFDENLPTNSPDVTSKLSPYLKDTSVFEGFSYTFGGGALKDVEKPAETELGFISGPGGRAVIYIDGHVKWRSDK